MHEAARNFVVRPAQDDDWVGIWPFLSQIMRAGETYTWPTDIAEEEARARWLLPSPWQVLVAVSPEGRMLGTARFGPNREGPGDHIAGASFLVDPQNKGGGVGRSLGEHVLDGARAAGYDAMQFNAVVETNTRAVALWQSLGFEILTTVPKAFRHPTDGLVGLHVMYRQL